MDRYISATTVNKNELIGLERLEALKILQGYWIWMVVKCLTDQVECYVVTLSVVNVVFLVMFVCLAGKCIEVKLLKCVRYVKCGELVSH